MADIRVKIDGDASGLLREIDKVQQESRDMGESMSRAGSTLTRGLTLPLIGAGVAAVKLAADQEEAEAKIAATLESMNAQTWTSVEALKAQAAAFQESTTFGDEAVLGLQDLLLTFGNVTDQVGDGNDVFTQATALGLDMSAALGQDLQSSAIQLGKALNDPIQGLTALRRVGIQFTDAQEDQIRTLQESGDLLGAQKIILGELENQFGGTAAAIADTAGGQLKQSMNAMGDAAESVGTILGPVLAEASQFLQTLAERFQGLSPEVRTMIVRVAGLAAAIGPLLLVGGKLVGMFKTVGVAFQALSALLAANPYVLLIAATVALVTLVVTNWDTIKEWTRNLVETLGRLFRSARDALAGAAAAIRDAVVGAFRFIVDTLQTWFFNWTLPGLIIKHWDTIRDAAVAVKDWVIEQWNKLITFFGEIPGRIASATVGMWDGIREAFRSVINWIIDKWNGLSFTVPSVSIFGQTFGGWTISTPNIPRLHHGGVFRSIGGGEGLAILRDGERVLPPGESGVTINVTGFVGSEMELAREIDRLLTRRSRVNGLGFT